VYRRRLRLTSQQVAGAPPAEATETDKVVSFSALSDAAIHDDLQQVGLTTMFASTPFSANNYCKYLVTMHLPSNLTVTLNDKKSLAELQKRGDHTNT
jgi:hypothetical protein